MLTNQHPVSNVQWIHRDELKPNHYNPNAVAPPELKLLEISIIEDGWTQPIVINPDNTIVDGFHRWTVSGKRRVFEMTAGFVPVVILNPKNDTHQQMSTIRHNRARGTHAVLKMADIVQNMINAGNSMQEICLRLQMEEEEVVRLANRKGIPKTDIIQDTEFSRAWTPE